MKWIKELWDKSFTQWPYRLALHIGFWFFYLFLWLGESMVVKITPEQHYWLTLIGAIFVTYLYYGITYCIWPLFKNKKWIWATLLFIVFYIIAVILRSYHINLLINWYNLRSTVVEGGQFWEQLYQTQFNLFSFSRTLLSGLSSLIVIVYVPLSIKFMRYVYQSNQQQAWILKENAQLQLNALKAQINPHFFFNTLNNLQSLIVHNEKTKSVDLLNRLADFMRTCLYDGDEEFISMKKEVAILSNYINIEKIRFEEDVKINYTIAQDELDYKLPPFIFLPFIENAFKHGGNLPSNEINIHIELHHNQKQIILKVINSFLPNQQINTGGIGLQNIRKRLDHYFSGQYQLDITVTPHTFNVNLEINK